jgi:hypothetical protein
MNQSFKKQNFTISGSVEIPDVEFKGFPRYPVSDASGRYSVDIPFGWSGTVTPVKKGYLFEPAERIYFNIKESAQAQDYIPRQKYFLIKGSTGLAGVHLTGLPEQLLTGPNGTYNTKVPYHWTGCITPQKDGYQFNPPEQMYTRVEHDWLHEDYTAQPIRQVSSFGPGKGDKPDLSFEDRRCVLIIGLDNGHDDIEKEMAEDMRVMASLLDDCLNSPIRTEEINETVPIEGSPLNSMPTQALYLPDYGPVFITEWQKVWIATEEGTKASESADTNDPLDPIWEQAKKHLIQELPVPSPRSTPCERKCKPAERTTDKILQTIKHASNMHHVGADQWITVIITESPHEHRLRPHTRAHDALKTQALTLRVCKRDIDAYAEGHLEFAQFRDLVILDY